MLLELDALADELHANRMKIAAKEDLVGALILAARRSPIEAIAAVVQTYWEREREEEERSAALAVAGFIRACG